MVFALEQAGYVVNLIGTQMSTLGYVPTSLTQELQEMGLRMKEAEQTATS